MKFFTLKLIVLNGLLMMIALPALAQNRAIRGKVVDDKDQPVIDAKITVEGIDVYRNFSSKTNKKGEYYFLLGLQAGAYRVIVRKQGFKPAYKDQIRPEYGEENVADFKLEPGQDYKLPWEMTAEDKEQYKKKLETQKQKKQFSAEVKVHFEEGVKLYNSSKYNEALAEFNLALEKDDQQPAIFAHIGNCYDKLNKPEEAMTNYDKAIALNPKETSYYTSKGILYYKMGKQAESQEIFKKAAELDPQTAAQNFYNLSLIQFNASDVEHAIESSKRALAADPNFAEAYYLLGMCYSGNTDTIPAAIEALNKYVAIGQKPENLQVAKDLLNMLNKK